MCPVLPAIWSKAVGKDPLVGGSADELCYVYLSCCAAGLRPARKGTTMAWTTPTLVEICIGLEINGYLPAEF
jgi:coenzyme PQQ precursor peptide PqqA